MHKSHLNQIELQPKSIANANALPLEKKKWQVEKQVHICCAQTLDGIRTQMIIHYQDKNITTPKASIRNSKTFKQQIHSF